MNLHILFLTLGVICWTAFAYWFGFMNGRSVGYAEGLRRAEVLSQAYNEGETGG